MSIQKLAKYTKRFDLIVIHEESHPLLFSDVSRQIFRNVLYKTVDQPIEKPLHTHLLILSIEAETMRSPEFKAKLAHIHRFETLVLTSSHAELNVMKQALSMRACGVSALPQDEEQFVGEMIKVFPLLIKKFNDTLHEGYHRHIAEHSNELFAIVRGGRPLYVNEPLKKHFAIDQAVDFLPYITGSAIHELIHIPGSNQKVIELSIGGIEIPSSYFVNTYPLKEGDLLISLFPLKVSLEGCEKRLLNRMSFIELLKDAFLIREEENESLPVIVFHITNSEKIIENSGENVYNDLCKEILKSAQSHFGPESDIAQWHKDVYTVMMGGEDIEELKEKLDIFHQNVIANVIYEGNAPTLDSFVIDMHGVDLNKAIAIIDHMHQKQLLAADIANLVHYEISNVRHDMDESKQALHYLEKVMLNQTPIKLLNFYKGIRISTPARLMKLSDGYVYVGIEKMQGYAMKLEQHTVIQAANLPFDLQAGVKIVDVGKKVAVLNQFQTLKASANNRQYIRIQSDHRMHVTLTSAKNIIAGTIMDISIKSIACKVSNSATAPKLDASVLLQFSLPLERMDGGMVNMVVEGKIQYLQKEEEFTKVVVILLLQEPYESFLIEYIYNRQQALINEIKTIANKL